MQSTRTSLVLAALIAPAAAQAIDHSLCAPPDQVHFGADVDALGDVDGDGEMDIVVSAPGGSVPGFADWVAVLRVDDGAQLLTVEQHAQLVAGVGDVNGDGVPDFAATSDSTRLQLVLHSGADGAPLWTWSTSDGIDALAGAGDTDLDGVPDVLVGDNSYFQLGAVCCGLAGVLSGDDGRLLLDLGAHVPEGRVGRVLASVGDVDGDGAADVAFDRIILPSPFVVLHLASGQDGHELTTYVPPGTGSFIPQPGPLGDLDGDGQGEYFIAGIGTGSLAASVIAFIEWYSPWEFSYAVTVVSGASGATALMAPALDKWLSGPLVGLPDVDDDGLDDLLVASTPEVPSLIFPGCLDVLVGAQPVITSLDPAAVTYAEAVLPGALEVTISGQNLAFVTEVRVGAQTLQVFADEVTVLGPDELRFKVPTPDALGSVPVSVATPTAQSNTLAFEYTETHPPVIEAPPIAHAGETLAWSMWGEVGATGVLLASGSPETFQVKGWDVLRDFVPVAVLHLDGVGAGSHEAQLPAGVAGFPVYAQLVTLKHGLAGASNVESTLVY
jgi:hypothetical protein